MVALPNLLNYTYSEEDSTSELSNIYDHWVIFSPETGSFSFTIGEQTGIAKKGDFIFCPPNTPIHKKTKEKTKLHFLVIDWIGFNQDAPILEKLIPTGKVSILHKYWCTSFYNIMSENATRNDNFSIEWKNIIVIDLWFLICNEQSIPNNQIKDMIILQAIEQLTVNYKDPNIIVKVTNKLNMTPVQFTRIFKKETNTLPIAFLTNIRFAKICEYLKETDWTLQKIAEECGYADGYYLSKTFKKRMNMTPKDYRKTYTINKLTS